MQSKRMNTDVNVRGSTLGVGAAVEVQPPEEQEDKEAQRIATELLNHSNWSQKIRYLKSEGFRNSSISHILSELRGYPLSPQHVNNVLQRPLKGGRQGRRPQQLEDPLTTRVINILPKPTQQKQ